MGSPYTLLQHLREEKGLSCEKVAKLIGVSVAWYNTHENPRERRNASGELKFSHLRTDKARRLEAFFGIPISELRKPYRG